MVGESRHNAVSFLVIEQFLVAASYRQLVAGNFPRQREAAVVDVGCSGTFGAAQLDGLAQQGRALATDTDYAEANAVISGTRLQPDLLSALCPGFRYPPSRRRSNANARPSNRHWSLPKRR